MGVLSEPARIFVGLDLGQSEDIRSGFGSPYTSVAIASTTWAGLYRRCSSAVGAA